MDNIDADISSLKENISKMLELIKDLSHTNVLLKKELSELKIKYSELSQSNNNFKEKLSLANSNFEVGNNSSKDKDKIKKEIDILVDRVGLCIEKVASLSN